MDSELLLKSLNIRNFEKSLLDLFPKGILKGTTHTSLGQETNAVGVISAIEKNDVVVSNHRCHGHYLSHTDDYKGLLNEILGKENGVCGGMGGSQHLCFENKFFSNGILGGNSAMAAGISYALKFQKSSNIVCLFIGDGTLGQGILYETLNMIGKNRLPILIIIEDNDISQSTFTKSVLPGNIENKIKAFDIESLKIDYPNVFELSNETKKIVTKIRLDNNPYCLIIKSNRLGPHSKGDDTRTEEQLINLKKNDTLEKIINKFKKIDEIDKIQNKSLKFIEEIFNDCLKKEDTKNKNFFKINKPTHLKKIDTSDVLNKANNLRLSDRINLTLHQLFEENKELIMIGEDLLDPYGGAFKVTKGLSTNFSERVYSSPICEAGIIGFATGMAIQGLKPIVEIMFGDFLTLGFDQILNNACKFRTMYNFQVKVPLVIRTPMGGRRGYGPTHSQSIEKHFLGIDGLNIYAINPFQNIKYIYEVAINSSEPSLIIENKIDYSFIIKSSNNNQHNGFYIRHSDSILDFNVSFSLTNFVEDEGTVICYGGMLNIALNAVQKLYIDEEISFRVVCIGKIFPLNYNNLIRDITEKGKIITIEENTSNFGLGSEICFELYKTNKYQFINKLGSDSSIIPSSFNKEKNIMLDEAKIYNYLKNII